jgi:hypothetical protein
MRSKIYAFLSCSQARRPLLRVPVEVVKLNVELPLEGFAKITGKV